MLDGAVLVTRYLTLNSKVTRYTDGAIFLYAVSVQQALP